MHVATSPSCQGNCVHEPAKPQKHGKHFVCGCKDADVSDGIYQLKVEANATGASHANTQELTKTRAQTKHRDRGCCSRT